MSENRKLITEKDIPVGKGSIDVLVDGYEATIEIYECTWSDRVRINFKKPHPRWEKEFQTKYFQFEKAGEMSWGHDGEVMKIVAC
jgi:hypothetical protein